MSAQPVFERGNVRRVAGWLWFAVSGAFVITAPSLMRYGVVPWRLPMRDVLQIALMGASYFALAVYVVSARHDRPRGVVWRVIIATIVLFAGAYGLLVLFDDFGRSRVLFAVTAVCSAAFAVQPVSAHRTRSAVVGALAIVATVGLALLSRNPRDLLLPRAPVVYQSALAPIEVRHNPDLTGPALGDGGGIVAWGDRFLVITGRGALFRIEWDRTKTFLRSERLPVPPPMDRGAYLADQRDPAAVPRYRVTDLTIDTTTTPVRLFVAHQYWNHDRKCFTLRVSSIRLDAVWSRTRAGVPWTTEFESQPCLPVVPAFDDIETGGQFGWTAERRLLLTIGDHGFNGIQSDPYPQDTAVDYGKVFQRDIATRSWKLFTFGHRNPQGLTLDSDGRIWETEHGPQGGDELNVLVQGHNYGWPFATYGTEYGATFWPLTPEGRDHAGYAEPAFVFVPSIGVSSLIEVQSAVFPEWRGDLLLSSLRTESLWRVRRQGGRIVYVEPLPIGRRVRDLVQTPDGLFVLWTDEGDLVTISRPSRNASPRVAFGRCTGCHVPSIQGTAMGPSLRGVFERRVGGDPGYDYSAELRRLGGTWTAERLDAFLENPARYAPGTKMQFRGVADADERRLVIEYLRAYR